jgi:hypothetical protein
MIAFPAESVKLLRQRVLPISADKDVLSKWIAELDSPSFATRDRATRSLASLGSLAEEALTKRLRARPPLESIRRIEHLLDMMKTTTPAPEQLRLIRAVEVLEGIGTPDAVRHLQELRSGVEGAFLTTEARAALDRLSRR